MKQARELVGSPEVSSKIIAKRSVNRNFSVQDHKHFLDASLSLQSELHASPGKHYKHVFVHTFVHMLR